jgi:hypothetical protein
MVAAMRVIGMSEGEVWGLAARVTLDDLHSTGRLELEAVIAAETALPTSGIAGRCRTSLRRPAGC